MVHYMNKGGLSTCNIYNDTFFAFNSPFLRKRDCFVANAPRNDRILANAPRNDRILANAPRNDRKRFLLLIPLF